ncbi:MAG: 30S ribosomal protein S15 [Candidatus Thermoplasmatota archaeon]|nr:30S ribosomal protein S15 [Candidatus Thermoplasmatota archaeon]MCL5955352.1 30S ribosomal protein S15 [Candidatus Thermoplasmatota archaeon]
MARMHTRKRGKSKSRRIYSQGKPDWIQFSNEEVEKMIVDLKKAGTTNSVIGVKLRDQYGIPGTKTVLGKKLGKVLQSAGIKDDVPEDLLNLIKKYRSATKHMDANRNDMSNKRGQALLMAKILRLVKYYKRSGSLAPEWNLSKVL